MSLGWGVRSTGVPYFGFVQQSLEGMSNGPFGGGGDFSLALDVSFEGAPIMHAAVTEEHALFSWFQYPSATGNLLEIGVCPDGTLYGRGPSTNRIATAPGFLTWDRRVKEIGFEYSAVGPMNLIVDGVYVAPTVVGVGGQPQPTGGRFGKFALFQGPLSASRVPCTIYYAGFGDENGSQVWDIGEGAGQTIADIPHNDALDTDFDLRATYWTPPFYSSIWGTVPATPLERNFKWKFANRWGRVQRARNDWVRH